ncbi:MAG: PhnD/SsuA/transferrin family substrate-binding protein, partial [Rubrivivax sp.]|nr:PhnD/SsuA/transferrin family substrate-binding protein [Rubrivivax sp.]
QPPAAASGPAARLNIGLVPFLSTRQMLGVYEPMRAHLERQLGRPVQFYTAASFGKLMTNARAPDQPFTMMPMHLGVVATEDWGFQWVARSTMQSVVQLWVTGNGVAPLPGPQALRGRRVAIGDPLSVVTLMFLRWRADNGLADSLLAMPYPNMGAALKAQQRGETDYVLAPEAGLRDALAGNELEVNSVLRIGGVLTPGFVASPAARPADVQALRAALLSFRIDGAGGAASGARFAPVAPGDTEPYRAYAVEARRLLAEAGVR